MKTAKICLRLIPLLLAVAAAGLYFGSAELSAAEFWDALCFRGTKAHRLILFHLRLPRVAAGMLAGVGLSTAGVLLQSVTGNALASPNIIGINSGAGLAVILALTLSPLAGRVLPLAAFAGAFAAAACILAVSSRLSGSRSAILLIGISITTLLNAMISFLSLLDEGVLAQYNHFTIGSLKAVSLEELALPAGIIALSFLGAMLLAGRLGVLCLGDSAAASSGPGLCGGRCGGCGELCGAAGLCGPGGAPYRPAPGRGAASTHAPGGGAGGGGDCALCRSVGQNAVRPVGTARGHLHEPGGRAVFSVSAVQKEKVCCRFMMFPPGMGKKPCWIR